MSREVIRVNRESKEKEILKAMIQKVFPKPKDNST